MASAVQEAIYCRALMMTIFGYPMKESTYIREDNQSGIKMCHNPVMQNVNQISYCLDLLELFVPWEPNQVIGGHEGTFSQRTKLTQHKLEIFSWATLFYYQGFYNLFCTKPMHYG